MLKQLSKEDVLFVAGETATFYQHTAGLVILDASGVADFTFESFRERVIERIRPVPNFRWRLHEVPLNLDLPYWVEDENFNYEHHFKRIAVPSPGGREELAELVAYIYSKHLDRSKPLWELWFIEGLADGKYAMLQKSHHCMMDGEGANKLSELLSDLQPDAAAKPVDKAITSAKAGPVPNQWQMYANTATHYARLPAKVSSFLYEFVRPKVRQRLGLVEAGTEEKPIVPSACFNGEIGSERGFVYGSLPLADIKRVKAAFDVSVNDVILALVGTSLRNYLLEHDALPEASLRTSMIVSLRTQDDDTFSNKVTSVSVTLATDVDNLLSRLRAINHESVQVKSKAKTGSVGVVEMIQLLPPLLVKALANATPAEAAPRMMGANLIVSNVQSSSVPLYIAGARLEAVHPMSIITQGIGINVTCVSYAGSVGVGVTIDPELVPDSWDIVDGLNAALEQYLALSAVESVAQKKSSGASKKKSTPARRKKPASVKKKPAAAKKRAAATKSKKKQAV